MAPLTRARAAQAAASSVPAMTIAFLPDELLERALGLLSLTERQQAALVSKRFAALCCSAELLQDVHAFICGMPDLDSLLAWLKRHGHHVLRLQFTVGPAQGEVDSSPAAAQRSSAAADCLAAVGAAGKLEELHLYCEPLYTEWLCGMRSLQRATLFGRLVDISPAIAGATALQSLKLCADMLQFAAGTRLPSGITRLWASFDGEGRAVKDMPGQFLQLPHLQRLQLDSCWYSASSLARLSSLHGSLTRLDAITMAITSATLSALTRLEHLNIYRGSDQISANVLLPLTRLTCLLLSSRNGFNSLLPALSGLSRLRLCSLERTVQPAADAIHMAPLPAGRWLRGLQWLSVDIGTLLNSTAVLEEAAALECISITNHGRMVVDWSSPAVSAVFDWLAAHPPLRRLSVDGHDFEVQHMVSSPAFQVRIAQLGRRQPAVRVQYPSLGDEHESESFIGHVTNHHPF